MLLFLQRTLTVNIVSCIAKVITEFTTEWKHLGRFVWSHRRSLHDDCMSDLYLSLSSGVAIAPGKSSGYLAKQTRDYKFERLAIVSAPKENPSQGEYPHTVAPTIMDSYPLVNIITPFILSIC